MVEWRCKKKISVWMQNKTATSPRVYPRDLISLGFGTVKIQRRKISKIVSAEMLIVCRIAG